MMVKRSNVNPIWMARKTGGPVRVFQPRPRLYHFPNAEIMSGTLNLNPAVLGKYEIMIINGNALSGPFTEADLDEAFALNRPEANLANMAFFEA